MNRIPVPPGFMSGTGLLESGYPWLVPEAVDYLDEYITRDMSVIEFGSGGSTVFFANRCKHVTSCESSEVGYAKMLCVARKLPNVRLFGCVEPPDDIYDRTYDIAVVDSTHLKREYATEASLRVLRRGSLLVLDNYYCQYAEMSRRMLCLYQYTDYNKIGYSGDGTRIYKI